MPPSVESFQPRRVVASLPQPLQAAVACWASDVSALRCASVAWQLASQPAIENRLVKIARCCVHGPSRAAALASLAELLAGRVSEEVLELAAAALGDVEQQVREAALAALPRLAKGAPEDSRGLQLVLEAALPLLGDPAWSVRVGALRVLPELAPSSDTAVARVASCLEDPQWVVRTTAVSALRRSVSPGQVVAAVNAAAARLQHRDRAVRQAAGDALAELAASDADGVARVAEAACSHEDARVRRAALQALDQIVEVAVGSREACASSVKAAVGRLLDSVGSVREAALQTLGRLAAHEEAQINAGLAVAVAARLADEDPYVCKAAGVALQQIVAKLDAKLLPELLMFEPATVQHRAEALLRDVRSSDQTNRKTRQECFLM